nr:hypothetical protein [Tanacetum cinerariifolium]
MDSIISLGQKNTLAEYMILFGADNCPPMLDKDLYDSRKSRMELYMQNREHERMILESVEHGLFIWPTVEENSVIKMKKYVELSAVEKIQADCDIVAKYLWKRVQLLMQGTSLTKQDRECKFLPPEWSKFVTDVKLVKDLHTSNYDQLHAYLEQHELHANESHMNHQNSTVPQVACQSPQAPTQLITESSFVDSGFVVPVFSPGDDLIACLNKAMAFLTAVASSRFPSTNNQLRTSSNIRNQAIIQDGRVTVQQVLGRQWQGLLNAITVKIKDKWLGNTEDLNTYDSDCDDLSNAQAVLMANISNYGFDVISEEKANKEQNQESITAELERYKEMVKTFKQCINIDLSSHEKMVDSQMVDMIKEKLALKEKVDSLEQNLSKQTIEKECLLETFNVFKNKSKSKENKYMETKINLEQKIKEINNNVFKVGQSAQTVHMLTKPQSLYDSVYKQALGYQNPSYLNKAQRMKPSLYDGIVISEKHVPMSVIDNEETLLLEEESRSKMSEKAKDLETVKQNISHKPIDYEKLNRLTKDFVKRFTPQQELSAEQAFWLRISNLTIESSLPLVRVEVPIELPK